MRVVVLGGYYDAGSNLCSFFGINGHFIGKFPLTYTVLECVETWCESVGWKLRYLYKKDGGLYTVSFEVGEHEDIYQTIRGKRIVCV